MLSDAAANDSPLVLAVPWLFLNPPTTFLPQTLPFAVCVRAHQALQERSLQHMAGNKLAPRSNWLPDMGEG